MEHQYKSQMVCSKSVGRNQKKNTSHIICMNPPGLLHSYVTVEFFQSVLSSVMVHDEDALLHVRPLGSLEDRHWST